MGAAAIPYIISAIGAGASVINTRNMQKEQNDVASRGLMAQAANQREADAEVAANVGQLEKSSPENSRKQATSAFLDQLRRTRNQAVGETPINGSEAYSQDLNTTQEGIKDYGREQADIQGRINAPGLQRQDEGVSAGRLASRLGTIGRNSGADQFLTEMRLRGVQRNPWVDFGGQLAGGIGSGMASSGFGAKTPVPAGTRSGLPPSAYNVPRN